MSTLRILTVILTVLIKARCSSKKGRICPVALMSTFSSSYANQRQPRERERERERDFNQHFNRNEYVNKV